MTDALAPDIVRRITAAAAVTGHAVDALLAQLADITSPLRDVMVHSNADADAIGVSIPLPDDEWLARRMADLANAISPSPALAQVAVARRGRRRAACGIGRLGRSARGMAGAFSAMTTAGPSTLAAELAVAGVAGIPETVREQLAARARALGFDDTRLAGTDRMFRTIVYSGPEDQTTSVELTAKAPLDLLARTATSASILGLTAEEERRMRALHTSLVGDDAARAAAVDVRVTATQSAVEPGLSLGYTGLSVDDFLALVGQFAGKGVHRMEAFVSALAPVSIPHVLVTHGDRALGPLWAGFRLS